MGLQAVKQGKPARRRASGTLALCASLLPLLCGACSWLQALQDNFEMSFGNARAHPLALPVTEVQVRMIYPDGTDTVERAVNYMLEPHAYRPHYRDGRGELIAQRNFIGNFHNEPVPLSMALERLMGPDGQVVLDRDRKLYAFRLRDPDEPGVAFADLAPAVTGEGTNSVADLAPAVAEDETYSVEEMDSCASIRFRDRAMLSATVLEYFRECGFDEVSWRLGKPGRYADYRLLQNIDVPLPERHLDLIELLQARFGIRTLINEDNSVEFHDEHSIH